jgi:hypothetical protein
MIGVAAGNLREIVLFPRAADTLKVELYTEIAATPHFDFVVNFTLDGRVYTNLFCELGT